MQDIRKKIMKKARRIVIKVGSAVVAAPPVNGRDIFSRLAAEVESLKKEGLSSVVVSSGAIALGMKRLGITKRPVKIPERQAIASVGQGMLMRSYDAAFSERGMTVAQVLLTHEDLGSRLRFLNARNTLTALLDMGIVPIINENDTVAVEEIKFGDNDNLSVLTSNLAEAGLLIILSDIDGLYDKDPKKYPDTAMKIDVVEDVDEHLLDELPHDTNVLGTGGIRSKCEAARKAAHLGVATVIANGNHEGVIGAILSGEAVGTLFLPKVGDKLTAREHWLVFIARPMGVILVDEGAALALKKNKSLLPSGIVRVEGLFDAGEVVRCVDSNNEVLARGIVNYSNAEIDKIKGLKTEDLEKVLGYKRGDEVIHRDELVLVR